MRGAHTLSQDSLLVMAPRVVHFVPAAFALILLGCGDSCKEDTEAKVAKVGANADKCVENKNKLQVFNAQSKDCDGNKWYPAAKSAQEQKKNEACCLVLDNVVRSQMEKAETCHNDLPVTRPSLVCECYQVAYTNAKPKTGDCPDSAIGMKPITDKLTELDSCAVPSLF